MDFQFVPKSVTLNDNERHSDRHPRYRCGRWADCV